MEVWLSGDFGVQQAGCGDRILISDETGLSLDEMPGTELKRITRVYASRKEVVVQVILYSKRLCNRGQGDSHELILQWTSGAGGEPSCQLTPNNINSSSLYFRSARLCSIAFM